MTPFLTWLQGLGPMGHLAALVLGLVLPTLVAMAKAKIAPVQAPPATPTPTAPAIPPGLPAPDAAALVQQRATIDRAIESKRAGLKAELDKLVASPATAPA